MRHLTASHCVFANCPPRIGDFRDSQWSISCLDAPAVTCRSSLVRGDPS